MNRPARLLAVAVWCFASSAAAEEPSTPPATDEEAIPEVVVRGRGWSSPRGLGDTRIEREQLEASPRQQTSEMLSAAPGFFVDHEDGEGLGNDVFLRGFDLEHGSGIEMRLGTIPINIPLHIQGQGYADANFIIPEVVRGVRVLEGPFDPRQGDAAIVGSAYFDLGVPERGYQVRASYGSFRQARVVAIAAPAEADADTFVALSLRRTDGFGQSREGVSGALNAQYGLDLGDHDHLRFVATAYAARSSFPGVVRRDDVDAGRIDFYGGYPYYAQGQGAQSSRVIVGASFDHQVGEGAHFLLAPWFMWTGFRARQNFTGNLESSQIDPTLSGLGDLFETTNREYAAGLSSNFRTAQMRANDSIEAVAEPGVYLRWGHTDQAKNLLNPDDLQVWDRRIDATIDSLDAGAYIDLDTRIARRLRLAGGPRADLLSVSVDDRLTSPAGAPSGGALTRGNRNALGVVLGLHATLEYEVSSWLVPAISYGEGYRSLDAERLPEGSSHPYSRVRSVEAGLRSSALGQRYTAKLAAFQTWVGNELVFEATSGGLETQNASVRRGFVASLLARPAEWFLASFAFSATDAVYATRVPGVSHTVPNVPAIIFRSDVTVRGMLARIADRPVTGRMGLGYTLLAGRHLTDTLVGPTQHVVNAGGGLRYGNVEVGLDAYNLIGLKYADDEQVFVSNWSFRPGQQPASLGRHVIAAPPRTLIANVSLYF